MAIPIQVSSRSYHVIELPDIGGISPALRRPERRQQERRTRDSSFVDPFASGQLLAHREKPFPFAISKSREKRSREGLVLSCAGIRSAFRTCWISLTSISYAILLTFQNSTYPRPAEIVNRKGFYGAEDRLYAGYF